MDNKDELIQYFIVNKDLEMSTGKVAAQVAHVADDVAERIIEYKDFETEDYEKYIFWKTRYNKKKIILRGSQKDLEKLVEQGFQFIRDNGLTEIEPNSLTCVSLGVMTREEAKPYIKRLQLL